VFEVRPDGTVSGGRLFAEIGGEGEGMPDGLKVDGEGNVYCTGPGGIHVLDPSGSLLGRIKIPAHVNNMGWGGDDRRTLFVTTDTAVFRVRLGIPGPAAW
jgi:gluconolactonase